MHTSHKAVLSLSVVGVLVGFQAKSPITAIGGRYEADGVVVQALGACSYDADSVQCWDLEGKPLPELSSRLESHFIASNGNELTFRMKKKNRLLVVSLSRTNAISLSLLNGNGSYSPTGQFYDNSSGSSLQWLFIGADPDATTETMQATIFNNAHQKVKDIAFRKGEKSEFDGATIEIGEPEAFPKQKMVPRFDDSMPFNGQRGFGFMNPTFGGSSKLWSVPMGVDVPAGNTAPTVGYALDKKGQVIQYVDKNGKVVSPVRYLESLPKAPTQSYNPNPSSKYFLASFQAAQNNVPRTLLGTTNIDPAEIGSLHFQASTPVIVRFENIPLDPK